MPDRFRQPPSSALALASGQQQDAYVTPAPARLQLEHHKQHDGDSQQRSAAACDASPTPDQASAGTDGRQQSKSLTPGLRSRGTGATAASGSSTEDGDMDGTGSAGPSRRKGPTVASQRAAPYGPKTSFARNTPYARFAAGKANGAAAGAPPGNPLLQRGLTGNRPPLPGPFSRMPPAPNGLTAAARQNQQQPAGADVFINAAWNSRQARGANRPGTPWASIAGELRCPQALSSVLQLCWHSNSLPGTMRCRCMPAGRILYDARAAPGG